MGKLKPWYHSAVPREDLRENRPLDASEFAVHLNHVREGRAHSDYVKPERFFDRTFWTQSLLDLGAQVVRRLSGVIVETSAVFNLATQFGGGKTHALAALYHLAQGGEGARRWKGVPALLAKARVESVSSARVAVFVGTDFDVLEPQGGEGEPKRYTPWGEIAWQLDPTGRLFEAVANHDEQRIAPGGDVIRKMLPDGPTLILVDELMNYVSRGRKLGMGGQLYDFLQNLAEEIRARDNAVLCVSIPASLELEMNPETQRDYDSFKKLLDRVGKAIRMSSEGEVTEIIRRRLFEWSGLSEDARQVAAAYADWALEHDAEVAGVDPETVHALFESSYPFHPAVISVFERKWQTLPRFQRTRGVLRLLALWVSWAYEKEHKRASGAPLITLGSAPLESPDFREAAFEELGSDLLSVPVTTDIVGDAKAHAVRLDKEAAEPIRKARLHQQVATAIFFESNGGQSQSKAEASAAEVKMAVGGPGVNLAEVDQVLEGLADTCFYLSWDRNRYRFGIHPNLNQMLVARRGGVQAPILRERLRSEVETVFREGRKDVGRRYFPEDSSGVPDRAELTLVVLAPERARGEKATEALVESVVRDCGSSGRTFKSALIFCAVASALPLEDAARTLIAWEEIDEDSAAKKRLDEAQLGQLARSLKKARGDFREAVWRGYRYLYLLDKSNQVRSKDLGQLTSSMGSSLPEYILSDLAKEDLVTEAVGPNQLLKYWPPAVAEWSTRGVRDAFFASPLFPRLLNPESIRQTIARGVSEGLLGYGHREVGGRLVLDRFRKSLGSEEVEVSENVYVLREADARRLEEPPKLARLSIHPPSVDLRPRDRATFRVTGEDQYGKPFDVGPLVWTASSGAIADDGTYAAEEETGVFSVTARSRAIEAVAQVRVTPAGEREERGPEPPRTRVLSWSGEVPPQKWMNLYTKVLRLFINDEGFRVSVGFEVPMNGEGEEKLEEAKAALRELSLPDGVKLE